MDKKSNWFTHFIGMFLRPKDFMVNIALFDWILIRSYKTNFSLAKLFTTECLPPHQVGLECSLGTPAITNGHWVWVCSIILKPCGAGGKKQMPKKHRSKTYEYNNQCTTQKTMTIHHARLFLSFVHNIDEKTSITDSWDKVETKSIFVGTSQRKQTDIDTDASQDGQRAFSGDGWFLGD